ncbi:MAG: hypothetical protein IPK59_23160, partial [Rhodospirillaceae bacterium]|nr:hypothetical protein [Rhodospirillaceae bacterium]
ACSIMVRTCAPCSRCWQHADISTQVYTHVQASRLTAAVEEFHPLARKKAAAKTR